MEKEELVPMESSPPREENAPMAATSPEEETGHSSAEPPPGDGESVGTAERTRTDAEVGAPQEADAHGG
eukprot:2594790-Pleurochrysis_carterae.AAC.1